MNPKISLIFCSRKPQLSDSLIENINQTIGCTFEFIVIDNSMGTYSITEAYQIGFERSKGTFLAFLHDDIMFHTQNWGLLLQEHLSVPGTGICGIGGRDTLVRVPSSWKISLPYIHIIQSEKNGENRKVKHRPSKFTGSSIPVVMLDGVVLCMHRDLLQHIHFDKTLTGFHAYDFDSCIRSTLAGFQNFVMYNIDIEHFSKGNADISYYRSLITVFKNHRHNLPLSVSPLSKHQQLKLEKKGLNRLIRKLIVKGFKTDEIINVHTDFSNLIIKKAENAIFMRYKRNYLQIKIWIIRTFYPLLSN